jgi:hypothetical protein
VSAQQEWMHNRSGGWWKEWVRDRSECTTGVNAQQEWWVMKGVSAQQEWMHNRSGGWWKEWVRDRSECTTGVSEWVHNRSEVMKGVSERQEWVHNRSECTTGVVDECTTGVNAKQEWWVTRVSEWVHNRSECTTGVSEWVHNRTHTCFRPGAEAPSVPPIPTFPVSNPSERKRKEMLDVMKVD